MRGIGGSWARPAAPPRASWTPVHAVGGALLALSGTLDTPNKPLVDQFHRPPAGRATSRSSGSRALGSPAPLRLWTEPLAHVQLLSATRLLRLGRCAHTRTCSGAASGPRTAARISRAPAEFSTAEPSSCLAPAPAAAAGRAQRPASESGAARSRRRTSTTAGYGC